MPAAPSPTRSQRRPLLIVALVGAVAVVIVAAGGLYVFFRGDAPEEASLTETAEASEDGASDGAASSSGDAAEAPAGGIEGTWSVDTSVGEFSVEDNTDATFVGFRVEEELTTIGSTTAVGRTPKVTGTLDISGETVTAAEITADLTAIVSNESRRETPIQRALNTGENPEATFTLTSPIELGAGAATGEVVETTATGQLTVNGTTNDAEFTLQAQLTGGMIQVAGSTEVVFADYNVTAPSAPVVVSVEDHGIVEFKLWFSS